MKRLRLESMRMMKMIMMKNEKKAGDHNEVDDVMVMMKYEEIEV